MAQIDINSIEKIDKEHPVKHTKVASTYSIFEIDGEKFVQIDTYGNSSRARPESISQTFQIDKECARFLANLLITEFDLLA